MSKQRFEVDGYQRWSPERQEDFWKQLKQLVVAQRIPVEVKFTNVEGTARIRSKIYEVFGGQEIHFLRVGYATLHVLISPEKIRTTATPTAMEAKPFTGTHNSAELKRYREVPNDFAPEGETKVCRVCGRRLPKEAFGRRSRGSELRQSYCRSCNRAYSKWRYITLCELGVDRLTPEVTEGHRKRNDKFHEWFQSYQE